MLRIVVLLENDLRIASSTHLEILESPQELIFKDFDVVHHAHYPIDLVKPSHPLSRDAPPHHNLPTAMFDRFLDKSVIVGLSWPEPCVLTSI